MDTIAVQETTVLQNYLTIVGDCRIQPVTEHYKYHSFNADSERILYYSSITAIVDDSGSSDCDISNNPSRQAMSEYYITPH